MIVFSAIGWCVAGLFALEGSDAPLALRMRAAPTFSLAGVADRAGLGIPLTRAQALAVVSCIVAAAGLWQPASSSAPIRTRTEMKAVSSRFELSEMREAGVV